MFYVDQTICSVEAALLHDTVEDTDTTFEELEQEFGEHVTSKYFNVLLQFPWQFYIQ